MYSTPAVERVRCKQNPDEEIVRGLFLRVSLFRHRAAALTGFTPARSCDHRNHVLQQAVGFCRISKMTDEDLTRVFRCSTRLSYGASFDE